jgi:hypothetical protein
VPPLLRKLDGGDLRSKGRSEEVVREVLADLSLVRELAAGLRRANPLVRMRCADALEKVSRTAPQSLRTLRRPMLRLLRMPQPKEVLWHLLQIAPRIRWSPSDLIDVNAAASAALADASNIVKACALQALVELLAQDPRRAPEVRRQVSLALASATPAVRARARKLMPQLKEVEPAKQPTRRAAPPRPTHLRR